MITIEDRKLEVGTKCEIEETIISIGKYLLASVYKISFETCMFDGISNR